MSPRNRGGVRPDHDPGPVPEDAKRQRYAVLPLSEAAKESIRKAATAIGESQAIVINAITAAKTEGGVTTLLDALVEDVCAGLCKRKAQQLLGIFAPAGDNGGALGKGE